MVTHADLRIDHARRPPPGSPADARSAAVTSGPPGGRGAAPASRPAGRTDARCAGRCRPPVGRQVDVGQVERGPAQHRADRRRPLVVQRGRVDADPASATARVTVVGLEQLVGVRPDLVDRGLHPPVRLGRCRRRAAPSTRRVVEVVGRLLDRLGRRSPRSARRCWRPARRRAGAGTPDRNSSLATVGAEVGVGRQLDQLALRNSVSARR